MSHLKQALFRVSKAGNDLATQTTGDDLSDLAKALCFDILVHEVKLMLLYACDDQEVPEETFIFLKRAINAMDEDAELAVLIKELTEATDDPADGPGRDYMEIV